MDGFRSGVCHDRKYSGVDYGLATCNNAGAGVVTVTATGANVKNATITAALTCK